MAAIPITLEASALRRGAHRLQRLPLVLALSLLSSRPLQAETADTPREASRHFERGYQLAQEGKLEAAIDEFKQAYALKPHPLVLYNLGQAYAACGRSVEAVAALERYLAETAQGDGHRAQATAMIEHQRQRVGELVLQVSPPGAEISVDGVVFGMAPLPNPIEMTAGPHGVLARRSGYEAQVERVHVIGKQRITVSITLQPTPVLVPQPKTSTTNPAVAADGALLTLRRERRQRLRIQRGSAIATGGLGIWSLALATIIYVRNQNEYQDWNRKAQRFATRLNSQDAPTGRELDQLLARENTLRNRDAWALGLGVLGGVLSATSTALWLSLPGAEPARLSFQLGPNNWLGYSSRF